MAAAVAGTSAFRLVLLSLLLSLGSLVMWHVFAIRPEVCFKEHIMQRVWLK
jgi:hypothetical protein